MKKGRIKNLGKRLSLSLGIYGPARYISDRLTNPIGRKRIIEDIDLYSKILGPDSFCFDIGANQGVKSLAMLTAGAKVVAFEPQPKCIRELKARCRKYENKLIVCDKALGSNSGTMVLHTDELYNGKASFHTEWEIPLATDIKVQAITLDEAIAEFGKPDYCKIDVEGWEFEVLSGLSESIPLISFEYHMNERELETTRNCIERLHKLSKRGLRLNLIGIAASRFEFSEWLDEDRFWKAFPDNFHERGGYHYGDIWVRSL